MYLATSTAAQCDHKYRRLQDLIVALSGVESWKEGFTMAPLHLHTLLVLYLLSSNQAREC